MATKSTMLATVFALSFAAAGVVSAEGGDTYTDTDASAENLVQQGIAAKDIVCLLYTSPSPRDATLSRMPSSA